MNLWMGPAFAVEAAPVLEVLLMGAWINGVAFIPHGMLQGQGRPDVVAKVHAFEIVPYVLLLWFMLSKFGILGAAIAWNVRVAIDAGILLKLAEYRARNLIGLVIGLGLMLASYALAIRMEGAALIWSFVLASAVFLVFAGLAFVFDENVRRIVLAKYRWRGTAGMSCVIAFYLPQFHPIPENDKWWGKGFTEWTNTAKALPLFRGHYQPHVPADLGFYDLRAPETRQQQADMALEYGVDAFCYYHYWFGNGRRIIERPFNEVLETGKPDFPFCLCWANQTWTGIWHGAPNRILMEQTYPGYDDHARHFDWLATAFADRRYITIEGKPLFVVFQPLEIPNVKDVTEFWRQRAVSAGFPGLYLVGIRHENVFSPASDQFGLES